MFELRLYLCHGGGTNVFRTRVLRSRNVVFLKDIVGWSMIQVQRLGVSRLSLSDYRNKMNHVTVEGCCMDLSKDVY